jgi:hypothetical protein
MGSLHLETAEEADSAETIELDEDKYPSLPGNVMDLRLRCKKAILRLYMAAARRGSIPYHC